MLTDARWPVAAEIDIQVVEPTRTVMPTVWGYDPLDPYAVHIDFGDPAHDGLDVVWAVARDLLRQGLLGPAGLGDVRVWPVRGVVWMVLESHNGRARYAVPRRSLVRFLRSTYAWVPPGEESAYVDVDATIARLLQPRRPRPC